MAKRSVKSYKLESEIPLPRWKVWDLLSNTDHLNRMIGLSSITYSEPRYENKASMYREILSKAGVIFNMSWKEYPFEWTKERDYVVEREYFSGPLSRFIGGVILEDGNALLENGEKATRVQLFADFTPANFLGVLGIPLIGKRSMKQTLVYLEDYLKLAAAGRPQDIPKPKARSKANLETLQEKMDHLRSYSLSEALLNKFKFYLIEAMDEEVAGMRPYALAEEWNVDREELLRVFLYATKEGILNLSWELMCPNCRVSKSQATSLSDIQPEFHCDLCGVNYEANFDRYVELHFSIAPSIRKAYRQVYCIGGPVATPHVYVQKRLDPGESVEMDFPELKTEWRLRVLGSNAILEVRETNGNESLVRYREDGWEQEKVDRPDKGDALKVENLSSSSIVVVLEKIEWDENAVTAAKVTTMQEFRDLFSSEVLAPGQQIKIENVTVLFSDLKDSTALYEIVGDAHAYSNVRRHFEFMTKWVRTHSGSVVKTMGDAVMAVFYKPDDAVKTAYAIHETLADFNTSLPDSEKISVKIGIHGGPAIVVNSNDRLDYFGRTVNIASRIQGKSGGDAFVVSEELFNEESVAAFFREHPVQHESFLAELKGIDEAAQLVRVKLKRS